MKRLILMSALIISVCSAQALADVEGDHPRPPCPGDHCDVPKRTECFNLVCNYVNEYNPAGYKHCRVASTFFKNVTVDGGEVRDDSAFGDENNTNPAFEIECDGAYVFKNSANRYTNLLGTRIQAQTGPFPAITLPRGALHSGAQGSSGEHVSRSTLEIEIPGFEVLRTQGTCYIWTGAP